MKILRGAFLVAVVLGFGCLAHDLPVQSTTALSSASLPTRSPPFALFVLRVADDALSLDNRTHVAIVGLEAEAERASRPVVAARYLLTATLANAVDAGIFDALATAAVRTQLIDAATSAAPLFRTTMEHMHDLLGADARHRLCSEVEARTATWDHAWGLPDRHAWLASLGGNVLDGDAVESDVVETTRRWAEGRIRVVTAALAAGALEPTQRIDLVHQLWTDDIFE